MFNDELTTVIANHRIIALALSFAFLASAFGLRVGFNTYRGIFGGCTVLAFLIFMRCIAYRYDSAYTFGCSGYTSLLITGIAIFSILTGFAFL